MMFELQQGKIYEQTLHLLLKHDCFEASVYLRRN